MLVDPKDQKNLSHYLAMSQAGLEMVVPIAIGLAVDYYCHSSPWGAVVGAAVGLGGGLTHLIYLSQRNIDDADKPPRPPSKPP